MTTTTLSGQTTPARPTLSRGPMVILVAVFLALAASGALLQRRAAGHATLPSPDNPVLLYLPLIVMEWGLVLYVWRVGLRGDRAALRDLIGGRWGSGLDVLRDAALALAAWGVWTGYDWGIEHVLGADRSASVGSLLPHRPLDVALWVALSVSAGFSEELVFRGYLQRQFRTLTGSTIVATILQAALFGVSHGYQGVRACFNITVFALLFTGLASWRRSLRPGMLAHAWTDVASGIFRI